MTMMATFLDVIDQKPAPTMTKAGIGVTFARPRADAAQLQQQWFSMDYARFWSIQDSRAPGARLLLRCAPVDTPEPGWALHHGRAAFLVECYDPARDQVGEHYCVRPGDLGMHLLIAPRPALFPVSAVRCSRSSCASCSTASMRPVSSWNPT